MYPNLTPFLVGLGGAGLLVTVVLALRGPLTRRLALRQVSRRRAEAALVVAGSVLGTAIIVGSLVVGDTLDHSFKQDAYRTLGVVDEVVSSPDAAKGAEAARRLEPLRDDPDLDGLLTVRRHGAAVASGDPAATVRKGEPQATVLELDFQEAARFEGPGSALAGPPRGSSSWSPPLRRTRCSCSPPQVASAGSWCRTPGLEVLASSRRLAGRTAPRVSPSSSPTR